MYEKDEKIDLYVPMKFQPGEYGVLKLDCGKETAPSECAIKLTYKTRGKYLSRPNIDSGYGRFWIGGVSYSELERLTAVYGDDGVLENIGIGEAENRRFLYIRIESLENAKSIIRQCAGKMGNNLAEKVLRRMEKGRVRRLFAEYYVDSDSFDYHVIYASEQEVQVVWDDFSRFIKKYPDHIGDIIDYIDNSGEYSHDDEDMEMDDDGCKRIALVLSCVPREWCDECFELAIETLDGCMKDIIPQLDRTDDFKFISEMYD